VTNGVLSKYQYNLQGGIDFNGNSFDINRTTTVVISDVGATKVEVPDEAKQKINAPAPSPAAPTSTPASPAPAVVAPPAASSTPASAPPAPAAGS
jgi:hypothetical protein